MRKRAPSIAIGFGLAAAAALACCLVTLKSEALNLQVMAWKAHIEGSEVIWPRTSAQGKIQGVIEITAGDIAVREFLQAIADWNERPVIIHAAHQGCLEAHITIAADMVSVGSEIVRAILRTNGFILEEESKAWSLRTMQLALHCTDEPGDGVLIRVSSRSR